MRAIWSGQIAFGLVTVPVKLYGATQKHDVAFHQVHDEDHGRIKYERRCAKCGEVVPYEHVDKAVEEDGQTLVLSDEDLSSLPAEAREEITVVKFVPAEQVDPMRLDTPYYLSPTGKAPKSYVLLRKTLEASSLTAVVRFTLRSRTRLGVLRARDEALVLQTLLWDEDIREPELPPLTVKVSEQELSMSASLVEQFSGDFDPAEFTDEYQQQLRELIDARLAEGDGVTVEAATEDAGESAEAPGKVVSLMDALAASLKARGAEPTAAAAEGKGSAKKQATTKQAAKKSAAKKAPQKKAPAKKSVAKKSTTRKRSA